MSLIVSDEVKEQVVRIISEELIKEHLDVMTVVDSLAASGCLVSYFDDHESTTR